MKGGCSCAGTIVTGGVVVKYGENEIIKVVPGRDKQALILLNALKERIPDLDTEIPDIYKESTRILN